MAHDVRTHATCHCGAATVRGRHDGTSTCANGHTTRWACCGGGRGRKHDAHDWAMGHCHGQGVQTSTWIVFGRDTVAA